MKLAKIYPAKKYPYKGCRWPKLIFFFLSFLRAELQIATTQDYATRSWFWTVFTGALNHQTTHHLFPGIIQSHYPKITPIVEQTCKEFGITYHYVDTTREALGCHIEHLKKLGRVAEREGEKESKNEGTANGEMVSTAAEKKEQ